MDTTTRALNPPRYLSPWEREVLETLLGVPFPGSEELRAQLGALRVSEEYTGDDPSVIFSVTRPATPPAPVRRRIPIEAEAPDSDGATIQILLHVVDGFIWELELYRPDGKPIQRRPDARSLAPYSLDSPAQARGRTDRVAGTA